MADTSALILGKRKRAQISYAEEDDELDSLVFGAEHLPAHSEDTTDAEEENAPLHDDDAEFGKRASKKAITAARKLKKLRVAANSKVGKNVRPFPFLELPAELRDMIYDYALRDDYVYLVTQRKAFRRLATRQVLPCNGACQSSLGLCQLHPRRHDTSNENENENQNEPIKPMKPFIPALLAVNKQIHDETIGLLYGHTFIIEDTYALHSFLAGIGPENSKLITRIILKGWGYGRGAHKAMNFPAFTLLSACCNLESLVIDCDISHSYDTPESLARCIYRVGYHFLENYSTAKKSKEAAVNLIKIIDRDRMMNEDKLQYRAELRRLLGAPDDTTSDDSGAEDD